MQIAMAPYNTPLFGGDWYVTPRARKKEYIQRQVDELEQKISNYICSRCS